MSHGHQTSTAENGREASRRMGNSTYDLIITDIYMPDQDGLETISSAKKLQPKTPIIAISSNEQNFDVLKIAGHLGASHCLRKPFSKETLIELVNTVLSETEPCPSNFEGTVSTNK